MGLKDAQSSEVLRSRRDRQIEAHWTVLEKLQPFPMADPKRPAFRQYLEDGGVIDILNRAMTTLSQENPLPADSLAFVREQIGAPPIPVNVDALIRENQDLTAELVRLEFELETKNAK